MTTWQIQTAKAELSALLRAVREEGPQIISVHGEEEFIVSLKERAAATAPDPYKGKTPKTIWDLFEPVRGLGDDLEEGLRGVREEGPQNISTPGKAEIAVSAAEPSGATAPRSWDALCALANGAGDALVLPPRSAASLREYELAELYAEWERDDGEAS